MRSFRKRSLFAVILIAFLLLTGFDLFKDVELSYKKPLIDLYGNNSPESPTAESEEVNSEEGEKVTPEDTKEVSVNAVKQTQERHIIGIKYKNITWDGSERSFEELEKLIRSKGKKGTEILLWDNYAEYHTYEAVIKMLREAREKQKFTLTERALEVMP